MVLDQLRPKLLGDVAPGPTTDRGGHVISICGAQGAPEQRVSLSISHCTGRDHKGQVALLDLHLTKRLKQQ